MTSSTQIPLLVIISLLMLSCRPPNEETNVYRREKFFPVGLNVPVALLAVEWAGKVRVMGSTWLIDGGTGTLFSAKHVTDAFINEIIELGGGECKIFLNGRVYDCVVAQVSPLWDAVVLKIANSFHSSELPKPYKIATEKVKVGEKVFIQGFHRHPREIMEANEKEGFKDLTVPILKTFYGVRFGNKCAESEVVFDSLEARVVKLAVHTKTENQEPDPMGKPKYVVNTYFQVVTLRNHKFSFRGLSGGVVVRLKKNGEREAVGIVTAEQPVKIEYDQRGNLISSCGSSLLTANVLLITPIESVSELVEYAKRAR